MPRMRELALERRVNELNELAGRQSLQISELSSLASDMFRFMGTPDYCDKVCTVTALCDSEYNEGDCLMRGVFASRMRELGIEV